MEPDVTENEDKAEHGVRDVRVGYLAEDDVVDDPAEGAYVHVCILLVPTASHVTQSLLEICGNLVLLLRIVLDVIIASIAVFYWTSTDHDASHESHVEIVS